MAFKPKSNGPTQNFEKREYVKLPVPTEGNQAARISMIVDLGEQEQEGFTDEKTGEYKPPRNSHVQEIAVFADLVNEEVDYGGDIGVKQYRLMLNQTWGGRIKGAKFEASMPKDGDGKMIQGKLWSFHPKNLLSRIAHATGDLQILGALKDDGKYNYDDNMDISQLMAKPLFVDVEVTYTKDKKDKKDDKGEVIVYTNIKAKNFSKVPMVSKGVPFPVPELTSEPMLITFDDATAEQVKMLRKDIIKTIQSARNYAGSHIATLLGEAPVQHTAEAAGSSDTVAEEIGEEQDNSEEEVGGLEDFDGDQLPF